MSCAAKERCYGVQDASPPAVARLFEVVGGLGYAQPTDHFKRLAMRRLLYLVTMALSLSTHLPLQTTCDAPSLVSGDYGAVSFDPPTTSNDLRCAAGAENARKGLLRHECWRHKPHTGAECSSPPAAAGLSLR